MRLHEFMAARRDQLIELAVDHLIRRTPGRSRDELRAGIPEFVDEVIDALRKADGLTAASPLPGKSAVAVETARQRRLGGFPIAEVAMAFGAVSASTGELGRREGARFGSEEYEVFDACLDTTVATAIEEYSNRERAEQAYAATERIGFLAHELRNALSTARMAFNLLRESGLSVRGRTGDILDRAHARMDDLIERALFTARIEAGAQPHLGAVRVDELLRDLEGSTPKHRSDVGLSVRAEDDLVALADAALLTSAVSNLVQNALKFSRPNGRVEVRGFRDGAYVAIEVEDECGGLPPGDPQQLFDAFVRRNAAPGSVGLGLAITRDAVSMQSGVLEVRDLPGKGCVFTIRLTLPPEAPS